eukprot:5714506-Amphidinium_carterae.1
MVDTINEDFYSCLSRLPQQKTKHVKVRRNPWSGASDEDTSHLYFRKPKTGYTRFWMFSLDTRPTDVQEKSLIGKVDTEEPFGGQV